MGKYKICFLTKLIPPNMYESISEKSTYNMQDAANALQWHIYEGLCQNYNDSVKLINVLPIGSFPQYYSDAFIYSSQFNTEYGNNSNVGFCNVKLICKYIIPIKVYNALMQEFMDTDEGILYVYTISSEFMDAVFKFKKAKPGIKICAVVADLPSMSNLSCNNNIVKRLFIKHLASKSYNQISCIDAFVLLTRQMADYMKIDKPFCVIEGISTSTNDFGDAEIDYSGKLKTILYSGTLHKRFGVMNLINAFKLIIGSEYKLVICGTGDCETEIRQAAAQDSRIDFRGQLPRNEILKLQKLATVLVNPRQNNEEFTKYSFPSKIMEYLSSGIPVVAYRLDGVPDEYENYIFYVKEGTTEKLAEKLREICEMTPEARKAAGQKGREFVLKEKNSVVQTAKIVRLMDSI